MAAHTAEASTKKSLKQDRYEQPDFYAIDDLFTEEHKLIRSSIREFVKKEISPFIEDWAQRAHFPYEIVRKFGEIGAFGPTVPQQYGGGGLDYISYGILMQEIERGDSGMRSTASVQGSLVMYPIYKFGSEEQRKKYLPKLASGEWLGCFGLTEPDHGSNPSGMVTNFKDMGDHYLLNGAKMWISNSPKAEVASLTALSICSSNSFAFSTMRIPLPPPPALALRVGGHQLRGGDLCAAENRRGVTPGMATFLEQHVPSWRNGLGRVHPCASSRPWICQNAAGMASIAISGPDQLQPLSLA